MKKLVFGTIIGGVLGGAFARMWILLSREPVSPAPPQMIPVPNQPRPYVQPQPTRPMPAPVQPSGPTPITSSPIPVSPGQLYRALVDVSAPLSWGATSAKIKAYAEKLGFTNVSVTQAKPASWPSNAKGDYYITGTYSQAPSTVQRGGTMVDVVEAWKG